MPGGGGTCSRVSIGIEILRVLNLQHYIHPHPVGHQKAVVVQSRHLEGVAELHLVAEVARSLGRLEESAAAQPERQHSIDSIERIYQS